VETEAREVRVAKINKKEEKKKEEGKK